HMSMENPPARGAWGNKGYPVDYNLESPLNFAQFPGDLPCRHKDRGPIVATYNAGQMIDVSFKKINTHMGGHCQFGLSYDNKNFVVLKTVFERCFLDGLSFKVPLPSGAPAGNAVLSWSWVNAEGNREYYMNCADVKINGPANGSVTGQRVVVANMPNTPRIGEWVHND
ncbi:putative endoglucanase precursor, partial [Syncephalis plumigaleata]